MSATERIAVAAHLHVLMRRHLGRATDVEWMARNCEYALEVVRLAEESPHAGLHEWAGKLGAFFAPTSATVAPAAAPVAPNAPPAAPAFAPGGGAAAAGAATANPTAPKKEERRYVGSLR